MSSKITSDHRLLTELSDAHRRTIRRWYRELGAELITVGSDAHDPSQVGQGVDVARELARRAGFSRVARYQRLRPV